MTLAVQFNYFTSSSEGCRPRVEFRSELAQLTRRPFQSRGLGQTPTGRQFVLPSTSSDPVPVPVHLRASSVAANRREAT